MSVVHDRLKKDAIQISDWYLRLQDRSIYGPVPLSRLCEWATQNRIAPENEVSRDRCTWILAVTLPELGMEWTATLPDGSRRGPFNLMATRLLVEEATLTPDTVLTNSRTGLSVRAGESLSPFEEEKKNHIEAPPPPPESQLQLHVKDQEGMAQFAADSEKIREEATELRDREWGKAQEEKTAQIDRMAHALAETREQVTNLTGDLGQRSIALREKETERLELASQLENVTRGHREQTAKLSGRIEALQREVEDSSLTRSALEQQILAFHTEMQEKTRQAAATLAEERKLHQETRLKLTEQLQQAAQLAEELKILHNAKSQAEATAQTREESLHKHQEATELRDREWGKAQEEKTAQIDRLAHALAETREQVTNLTGDLGQRSIALREKETERLELASQLENVTRGHREQTARLSGRIEALQRQVEDSSLTRSALEQQILAFHTEMQEKTRQAAVTLADERELHQETRLRLTEQLQQAAQLADELKVIHNVKIQAEATAQTRDESLQKQMADHKETATRHEGEVARLNNLVLQLTNQLERATDELQVASTVISEEKAASELAARNSGQSTHAMAAQLEETQRELEARTLTLNETRRQLQETRAALDAEQAASMNRIDSLLGQVNLLEQQINESSASVASQVQNHEELRQRNESARALQDAEIHALQDRLSTAEATIGEARGRVVEKEAELARFRENMEKDLHSATSLAQDLTHRLADRNLQAEQLQQSVSEREEECRRIAAELDTVSTRSTEVTNAASNELDKYKARYVELQHDAHTAGEAIDQAHREMRHIRGQYEAIIEELRKRDVTLSKRVMKLETALATRPPDGRSAARGDMATWSRGVASNLATMEGFTRPFRTWPRLALAVAILLAFGIFAVYWGVHRPAPRPSAKPDKKAGATPKTLSSKERASAAKAKTQRPRSPAAPSVAPPKPSAQISKEPAAAPPKPANSPLAQAQNTAASPPPPATAPTVPMPASAIDWPSLNVPGLKVVEADNTMVMVFDYGVFSSKTNLAPESAKAILELADQLKPHMNRFKLTIEGHCDVSPVSRSVDSYADNDTLSRARSDAILNLLKSRGGLPEMAMQSVPKGDANPPFPNTTAELRKKNRTVVLKLAPVPTD